MAKIKIKFVKNLLPVFTKQKRVKIIVGGRASTKSVGIADYVAAKVESGQLWCCAREIQNSIDESVHRTISEEIERLGIPGFGDTKNRIENKSGGRIFYKGLMRNVTSLKSMLSGIDGLWIEEGEDISENTLRVLTASVRRNTEDTLKLLAGEKVKMPEIIITMNRGSRTGAVAKKWLVRAEAELARSGYYEDDLLMVVQMNYTDMPKAWFDASGLEEERLDDEDRMSQAQYNHKWMGFYLEEIEGSIIKPEWIDACIDAHKIERLKEVFKPAGAIIAAHDPFDDGNDAGGYACRHGSIITKIKSKTKGEIDETCDWAISNALNDKADWFIWDGDGMGTGLKRQVSDGFLGKPTNYHMFKGSLSGAGQDNANSTYNYIKGGKEQQRTYKDTFLNNRSQYYIALADRCYNTYKCVKRGKYIAPEDMISFASEGIENLDLFKSQICRIPTVPNGNGLIQLMNKQQMKRNDIESPNESDSVMMTLCKLPFSTVVDDTYYDFDNQFVM